MSDSQVIISKGSVTYSGPDAVSLFQAIALRSAMKLNAATGLLPRRGFTKTVMLSHVTRLTGKDYRVRDFDKAIADLHQWIEAMKAAMPVVQQ
jgi:predicted transcriptional regulator of viral defense system